MPLHAEQPQAPVWPPFMFPPDQETCRVAEEGLAVLAAVDGGTHAGRSQAWQVLVGELGANHARALKRLVREERHATPELDAFQRGLKVGLRKRELVQRRRSATR